jgi:hypothetical protein
MWLGRRGRELLLLLLLLHGVWILVLRVGRPVVDGVSAVVLFAVLVKVGRYLDGALLNS